MTLILGEELEKTVYESLKTYFHNHQEQKVFIIHGYEIMDMDLSAKSTTAISHWEKDFIIINLTYGYVMNIEAKTTLNAKSLKNVKEQLEGTKKLLEKWFGADLNPGWVFISAVYCERDDKTNKYCDKCDMNFIFKGSDDLIEKLEKIHLSLKNDDRFDLSYLQYYILF